jgi:preprotein translocase subunit SecB
MVENQDAPKAEQAHVQPLVINGQFIKDFSFESPNAPAIFNELKEAPEIDVAVDVKGERLEKNLFEVDLRFNITGKANDKAAFIIDLVYGCVATLNVPDEHIEPMLLIEIPRHLFPFARNIIANSTQEAGFPPLLLTPIDFVGLYKQKVAKQQAVEPQVKVEE